jgi:hypothetical protein
VIPVIEPVPLIDIAMTIRYTIVQVCPVGITTVTPLLIVMGPALIAFLLVVIV